MNFLKDYAMGEKLTDRPALGAEEPDSPHALKSVACPVVVSVPEKEDHLSTTTTQSVCFGP